jgi:hypothetical protein
MSEIREQMTWEGTEKELSAVTKHWQERHDYHKALIPTKDWYPCCPAPDVHVVCIPGDTFFHCKGCGMHADNFGVFQEGCK